MDPYLNQPFISLSLLLAAQANVTDLIRLIDFQASAYEVFDLL